MLNNLDRFFDTRYPSVAAKYGAFLTWISAAGLAAVRMQVTFIAYRKLMETAAVELAANPSEKLLAKYVEALGACQIERLFKPASFSLESTPSPSPAALSKKRRLNMNVTPDEHFQSNRGHGGGRGRYNKNFCPTQRNASWFIINPNSGAHHASPSPSNRNIPSFVEQTPPSASTSTVTIRPYSPIRGRVLNWDDA
jgi:hypothetical protein